MPEKYRSWVVVAATSAAMILLLAAAVLPALGQGGVDVVGGDEPTLRELVGFLAQMMLGVDDGGMTVWVGALPDEMPLPLPLPDDARVVGSIHIEARQVPFQTNVLVGTDLSPEDVMAFYEEAASGGDWALFEYPGMGGGFTDHAFESTAFCYRDAIGVDVSAQERADGTTFVRFYIQEGASVQCEGYPENETIGAFAVLPQLENPEGVTIRGHQGGGGGGGGPNVQRIASNSVTLATELSPGALIELYNAQMVEAGWQLVTTEAADGFAWSGWTLVDDSDVFWSGVLTLTVNPARASEIYAFVQVEETFEE